MECWDLDMHEYGWLIFFFFVYRFLFILLLKILYTRLNDPGKKAP